MYDAYTSSSSVDLFTRTKIFSEKEIEARNEVKWEVYTKKVQIEARVLGDLVLNHVLPVATRYQTALIENVKRIREVFPPEDWNDLSGEEMLLIREISLHMNVIRTLIRELVEARKVINRVDNEREKAIGYHDRVSPFLEEIRHHVDKLEQMVDDQMWPLPKYREMLFSR